MAKVTVRAVLHAVTEFEMDVNEEEMIQIKNGNPVALTGIVNSRLHETVNSTGNMAHVSVHNGKSCYFDDDMPYTG